MKDISLEYLNNKQGFIISGGSEYGVVSGAGDINGDGINDIIIGAPFYGDTRGASYVIFGNNKQLDNINVANLTNSQGFRILGENSEDGCGFSVSGVGDVNGDNIDDVIIGAPGAGNSSTGQSYVIFGSSKELKDIHLSDLTNNQGFKIFGENSYDACGWSVSGAGDVNGDNIDDVIIGAPKILSGGDFGSGISYIIFGNNVIIKDIHLSNLTNSQGFKVFGANLGDASGYSVSGGGDINGDKIDDVIIGAPQSSVDAHQLGLGISYIIFGNNLTIKDIHLSNLISSEGLKISGTVPNASYGFSVSGAGDFNGDGFNDMIIGAPMSSSSYIVHFEELSPSPLPSWELYVLEIGLPVVSGLALIAGSAFGWYKYNYCNGHFLKDQENTSLINHDLSAFDSGVYHYT